MTKEEAIHVINQVRDVITKDPSWMEEATRVVNEAADMAIKALEAQRWIPCSERLPEKNGRYLVTRGLNACGSLWNRIYIVNYSNLMGIKSVKIWWQGNVGKSDFERLDDVLAWMPGLPEPYREGE